MEFLRMCWWNSVIFLRLRKSGEPFTHIFYHYINNETSIQLKSEYGLLLTDFGRGKLAGLYPIYVNLIKMITCLIA